MAGVYSVFGGVGDVRHRRQAFFLVGLEIAFKPFQFSIPFENQQMRAYPVKEETVMADDHGTAGKFDEGPFKYARHRFGVGSECVNLREYKLKFVLQNWSVCWDCSPSLGRSPDYYGAIPSK